MGYKLAGCEVIAANDIDQEMEWHYQNNFNPEYYFLCPIKDLIVKNIPADLFNLDILDGSPPCSTFSMSGKREKDWGKDKHFREGQAKQVLSDLFFDYLNLVNRLQPKVAIAENVKGIILGNAKGYTKIIMARFNEIGYVPQLFLINSADCGVPQKRERVFFCAIRKDLFKKKLELSPNHQWINLENALSDLQNNKDDILNYKISDFAKTMWQQTKEGNSLENAYCKITGKTQGYFTHFKENRKQPSNTIISGSEKYHYSEPRLFSLNEYIRIGSFPDDYIFKNSSAGKYMIGMSVPPKMTEYVAREVCSQWLGVKN